VKEPVTVAPGKEERRNSGEAYDQGGTRRGKEEKKNWKILKASMPKTLSTFARRRLETSP